MKCIVTSTGSAGDFLPTLAVGAALRRRGHQVKYVGNTFYESRARGAGLDFLAAGEHSDLYAQIEKKPSYLSISHATELITDFGTPHTVAVYGALEQVFKRERPDLLIANSISLGTLWKAAEHNVPSVVVHATPLSWMSWQAPTIFTDTVPPAFLRPPVTAFIRKGLGIYLTRHMRQLAQELGTTVEDPSFDGTEALAVAQLALWSPTLRGPVASDPANGTICGFVRASTIGGGGTARLSPEVEAFLADGPPPVVVGFGSIYALTPGPLLSDIAHACAALGRRCLVIGHRSDAVFPSNTLAVGYAPYDLIFPRAAAIVGHGGAGTTGEALRAGKPVVCVPFAFDQFAFSWQIEQLGLGVRVPTKQRSRAHFEKVLDRVLGDSAMRQRSVDAQPTFASERDGAEVGADAIERLMADRPVRLSA